MELSGITNWALTNVTGTNTSAKDTAQKGGGNQSLKGTSQTGARAAREWYNTQSVGTVTSGSTVTLSLWYGFQHFISITGGATSTLYVDCKANSAGTWTQLWSNGAQAGSTTFQSATVAAFDVSSLFATTDTYQIRLRVTGQTGNNVNAYFAAWWDNVVLDVTAPVIRTTVGDGSNPSAASLCPGGVATSIDAFTLQTNNGTDTVTAVQVDFALGTNVGVGLVEVLNEVGTVCGSATNPTDPQSITLNTTIPVDSNTAKNCSLRITPKTHANMAAVPGASYAVTAVISDITVSNQKTLSDSASATIIIDNLSPGNVTGLGGTAGDSQVGLTWTEPADADRSQYAILRSTTTPVAGTPTEGASYSVGNTIGGSTVVGVVAAPATVFNDTTAVNGTAYYYRVFVKDSCGNYSQTGLEAGPFTPLAKTTTVGNGLTAEPTASTLCPGDAITDLDNFTLKTSTGTDTVTSVTVTFAPAGASTNIGRLSITSDDGVTVYGFVDSPSDTQVVALTTNINVTTTETQYHIRITPKTHAAMPAVPGASYATTGTVTAIACTNAKVYSDSGSGTKTVDNASPSNATWGTVTPGNGQVVLNWTNPADADFSQVVIVRNTASISDAPVEGATYSVPGTIGSSDIIYVGSLQTFTDNTVLNGSTYYYKIFSKDTCGNYAAGAQTGPHTPQSTTTTVGNGLTAEPAASTLCPGDAITDLDNFTLKTSTGTDTVTSVTVSFAPAGASANIGRVSITSDDGATVYGFVDNPSDTQAVALTTNINVTTTETQYHIRITPRSHAAMPVVPGASYATTGTVTAVACSNSKVYNDSGSGTKTVDNLSPSNATWGTITPGNNQVTLTWTNPGGDFSQVVILRNTASITDTPVEGTTYSVPGTIGTSIVIHVGSGTNFTDATAVNGTAYYYKIFAKDTCGNYAAGAQTGPHTPAVPGTNQVSPGTPTAVVNNCNQITVSCPYTDDANGNSVTAVRRGTALAGPFSTVICSTLTGTSPRVCIDSTAAASTTYYYQVDFSDTDGVNGADPQVIGPFATPSCTAVGTTVSGSSAVVNSCRQITVTMPFTGDSNFSGSCKVEYNTVAAWPGTTACATSSGASPRTCLITGLAPSTPQYFIRVTWTDADGVTGTNPEVLGPFATPACAGDQVAPLVMIQSPANNAVIGGSDKPKVQVYDASGLAGLTVQWKVDSGALSAATLNANYACGANCGIYEFTLDTVALALSNGQHSLLAQATDAAGNIGSDQIPVQVKNLGGKAAGNGMLLRRTHGSEMCIDCHNLPTHSSQEVGSKYGTWGVNCLDCHTAHKTTNIYLVNQSLRTPNSGSKTVDFRYSDKAGGTNPQYSHIGAFDAGGAPYDDGICEACHTKTNHYRNDSSGGDHTHNAGARCLGCHKHTEGFKGAGCNGCHKAPPTVGKHGAHDEVWDSTEGNTATSYTDTASHGTATQYGFACAKCHTGTHVNDSHAGTAVDPYRVEVAFDTTANPANPGAAYAQVYPGSSDQGVDTTKYWSWTSTVAGTDGRCSNLYCHSNAGPVGGGTNSYATVQWNQAAALVCTSCHATTGATAAGQTTLSMKHASHINGGAGNYNYTCDECHADTIQDNSSSVVSDKRLHVNGAKDWKFSSSATAGAVNQSAGTYDMASTKTCSATYCHSQGRATTSPFGGAPNTALAWTTGTATCESCHNGNAAATNKMATYAHAAHMNQSSYLGTNIMCSKCHQDTVSGSSDTTINTASFHVNGSRDVKMSDGGSYAAWGCTSSYCHSSGQAAAAPIQYYNPPAWNSGTTMANDCKGCHGRHADNAFVSVAGEPNYTNGGAGNIKANSHGKHVNAAIDCANCHNDTSTTGTTIVSGSLKHIDQVRDVAIAATWDTNAGTKYDNYNSGTKTCSSIKCHGSGTPQWGGAVYCINCHGGASDVDNWNINDDTASIISTNEWGYSGHGKPTGSNYDVTNNPPANFTGVTNACLYCHDDAVPHSVGTNPFRLRSSAITNQVCLNCHATGSAGVSVDGVLRNASAATKINAYHYGSKHGAGNNSGKFCWDCHEPHGDRSSTPSGNISMVRANVTTQSDGTYGIPSTSSAVTFTARTTGTDFAKTSAPYTGICNVCHTTALHYRNNSGDGHMGGSGCTASCHRHDQAPDLAFKEKTACNACHNAPPPASAGRHAMHDGTGIVPTSYTNLTADTTATAYGYACAKCHTGTHVSDSAHAGTAVSPYQAQVVFDNTVAPMNGGGTYSQLYNDAVDPGADTIQNYSWTNDISPSASGKCTNIYCHSNAAPVGGTDNRASISVYWNQAAGSVTCNACHNTVARGDSSVLTDLSNAHGKHIKSTSGETGSYTYKCDECHAGIIRDNPNDPWALAAADITDKRNHVTGTHSVQFSTTLLATTINQSGGTYTQSPTYTCTGTYCHSGGVATASPFSTTASAAVAWNSTATCRSCHGWDAAAAPTIGVSTGSLFQGSAKHANHVANATVIGTNYVCADCHYTAVSSGNSPITSQALHVNGVKDISIATRGTYTSSDTTATCSGTYCHSDGRRGGANTKKTVTWTDAAWAGNICIKCHGSTTGTLFGAPDYTNGGPDTSTANSHAKHVDASADCTVCHKNTTTTGTSILAGAVHTNGAITLVFDTTVAGATVTSTSGSYTAPSTYVSATCTNVLCHGTNATAVKWGATNIFCVDCHGGTSDDNNWNISDGTISKINTGAEWTTYGHGSATVNLAQGKTGIDICRYCHDWSVPHKTATNPFRLLGVTGTNGAITAGNFNAATNNGNGVCWNCHGTGSNGVDPDGSAGTAYLLKNGAKKIDSYHYGATHTASGTNGGARCWDCHDGHGDATNLAMVGSDTLRQSSDAYGLTGTRSTTAAVLTTQGGGGYANTSTRNGICQVCHTNTKYWRSTSEPTAHNVGTDCTAACHMHDQAAMTDAFKGAGSCLDCHKSRTGTAPNQRYAVVGAAAGVEGDDFVRPSRHVSNGTTTSIVTDFDCILCHAEGDVTSSGTTIKTLASAHGGDGGTNTVDLRDVDSSGGTGITASWPGWRIKTFSPTTAQRDAMDSFCMGCHDTNGASRITVNSTNNGMDFGTTDRTRRLTPFNTNDTLKNARDTTALNNLRTRVLDVKSQFNSTNATGTNWASHHNLNQYTKRYTARSTTYWPDPAWTTYTTKELQNIRTAGEAAGLHCSDCHLNEVNAHGTRNTYYLLSDSTGADAAVTDYTSETATHICAKCHSGLTYALGNRSTNDTSSRTTAHNQNGGNTRCNNVGQANLSFFGYGTGTGPTQIYCLGCHGGSTLGEIHGTNGTYQPGTTGTVTKKYRFMGTGGSMRYYSPNNTATVADSDWTGTTGPGCYTIGAADTYGGCTQHSKFSGSITVNRARPLQY